MEYYRCLWETKSRAKAFHSTHGEAICRRAHVNLLSFLRLKLWDGVTIWGSDFNIHQFSDIGIIRVWIIKVQLEVAWISLECLNVKSRLLEQLPLIQDFKHGTNVFHLLYFFIAFFIWIAGHSQKVLNLVIFLCLKHCGFLKHQLVRVFPVKIIFLWEIFYLLERLPLLLDPAVEIDLVFVWLLKKIWSSILRILKLLRGIAQIKRLFDDLLYCGPFEHLLLFWWFFLKFPHLLKNQISSKNFTYLL